MSLRAHQLPLEVSGTTASSFRVYLLIGGSPGHQVNPDWSPQQVPHQGAGRAQEGEAGDRGPGRPVSRCPTRRPPPRRWPGACWLRCPSRWWSITATRSCRLQASAPHEDPREGVRPGCLLSPALLRSLKLPPDFPEASCPPTAQAPSSPGAPEVEGRASPGPRRPRNRSRRGGGLAVAPTPGPAPGGAGGVRVHLMFLGKGQQAASVTEKTVPRPRWSALPPVSLSCPYSEGPASAPSWAEVQ